MRHYRSLLTHPSVEMVNYWGITDAGSWLGAPGGLVRADGTQASVRGPAGLVKEEWWLPPTRLLTDEQGRVDVRGWPGPYAVTTAAGGSATSELSSTQQRVDVIVPH